MDFPAGQMLAHSDFRGDEEIACDVAVVGAGAGGAAAAWELSRRGQRVLILEEGRRFQPGELSLRSSWAYRNLYQERGTRLMSGNLYMPLPGGRAVGGSTLINSAICFRAPERMLRRWRELGLPWADSEKLRPLFEQVEQQIGVVPTQPAQARTNNLIFKQGAEKLGLKGDFIRRNAPGCVGCGVCHLGCPTGGKGSVDRNLIPSALSQGAALASSVRARRLLLEKGAAVGLEGEVLEPLSEKPLRKLKVRAKKVFLCAGAVRTPLLLLSQGLCNSSGQVGKNLRVHPASGMCARFEQLIDPWHGVTQGYYLELEDLMIETFSITPDLYFTQCPGLAHPLENLRHLASAGCMIGDESRGEVGLGEGPGRARIRYHLEEGDKLRLLQGLRVIAQVFFAAGALEVNPRIHRRGNARSLSELEQLCTDVPLADLMVYASHPMGTCRMGADRQSSVVSPSGESWEVKNLYLADASIFPSALGTNPQLTVMALAMLIAGGAA